MYGRAARLAVLGCACLLLLGSASATALPPRRAPAIEERDFELERRQLASSEDAAGNTVVYSVDPAGATTTIETLAAAAAATTAASVANTQGNDGQSQNLGQAASSPSSSSAPPTTYIVYQTVNGQQTAVIATFTATTPTTPAPIAPSSGTVLAYTAYITNTETTTDKRGSAASKKFSRQHGQVAAFGVLLSMLVGAIVVL